MLKQSQSDANKMMEKEIAILQKVTKLRHKNVVSLLGYKETARNVYLVMEVSDCCQ
jgi:hypothetical protein